MTATRGNGLRCIDRLEVGPVSLEPRKVSAPYVVWQGDHRAETDLAYKFECDVFDPDDPVARNLGTMVVAQAALNYGLFCDQIVVHGPLDAADGAFLRDMLENTNREILVHKLLMPNPFLVPGHVEISIDQAASVTGGDLVLPGLERGGQGGTVWADGVGRVAVLSSGGKESLLSFGLLREIGHEVHPVYINESGRHWYTALNAHRGFRETVPTTQRVWTNVDRLYNWMLRHLPFVRQDFATLRADQYPIRLWTVAGLVFGALPLLRARGIGRLVVGDEFDTSLRESFHGLSHYGGLYDQSRWFDAALTRYYSKKGWGVEQLSVLRPLSELLVQKMLAERYPDLHRWQVSCHAAHLDGERALPCGRCEKCRRVVGMHVAFGADPGVCGYTPSQVKEALVGLCSRDVHQEASTAEHVLWQLAREGRLPEGAVAARAARPHPEVMKLRFDAEHSPWEGLPSDLREPLLRIFLEHAEGAVARRGRAWEPFEVFRAKTTAREKG